jgi:hypothetical protein
MTFDGALPEVTELATHQAAARRLIVQAFTERLGDVPVETMFHRNWNGGWRCRATLATRAVLEFVLLFTPDGTLLAFPVPLPTGWRQRGVMAADGTRWTSDEAGMVTRVKHASA